MSSSSSLSASKTSSILAPVKSKRGLLLFRFTKKWSRFNLFFCAMVFAAYAIFTAHLLRTTPFLSLINLRQFSAPPPALSTVVPLLRLRQPYSVIKEGCKSYDEPTTCFESLASIPSSKHARSAIELVVMTLDEIFNRTIVVRSKMIDMLLIARENPRVHNNFQCGLLEQCVEMCDNILNFMHEYDRRRSWNEPLGGGTIDAFFDSLAIHSLDCVTDFDDESEFLNNGSYIPLKELVYSVWDPIKRIRHTAFHIAYANRITYMKLVDLNPPPLILSLWRKPLFLIRRH